MWIASSSSASYPSQPSNEHFGSIYIYEGLPDTGIMLGFSIPMGIGGGTTPISAPTGVPALGDVWCWALSRSCCSATLAARSAKQWRQAHGLNFTWLTTGWRLGSKQWILFTFIFCFLGTLQVSPLSANEAAQLPEGEVRVLGFDDRSHLTAEQDVAAHVDLPLRALLLWKALHGFLCGLQANKGMHLLRRGYLHLWVNTFPP